MSETSRRGPIVWVLLGQRAGDNAQAMAVGELAAEAAGGEVRSWPLDYNALYRVPNVLLGPTLRSLRDERRGSITAPWPDIVVGVGRRSVPVARWIKAQSGGRAKLVHIGRPRAPLAWFDLVISTPQYRLPDEANVLKLLLPPLSAPSLDPADLQRWRETFASLPRPWIGLLVGGARAPYRFSTSDAIDLAHRAEGLAEAAGGALLVTTSPRTGAGQTRALAKALTRPAHFNLWPSSEGGNAHHAILALADRFIVTGESVSMLAEACMSGRPVAVHDLPRHGLSVSWNGERGPGRHLARAGLASPPRDPRAVMRRLVDGGHASLLGAPEREGFEPVPDERPRLVAAIAALLDR